MAKASKNDSLWLISALEHIDEGGESVLIQGFTKSEIEQHWIWGGFEVDCELVMEQQQKGVLVSVEPFEPKKNIRVGYKGVLTLVSILVILWVCFG